MSSRKKEEVPQDEPWNIGPYSSVPQSHAASQQPVLMPSTMGPAGLHGYPIPALAQNLDVYGAPDPSASTMPLDLGWGMYPDAPTSTLPGGSTLAPSKPSSSRSVSNKNNNVTLLDPSLDLQCNHPGCGKTFKTTTELKKHKARHDLRFRCSDCDRSFGSKSDRDRHETTVHSQDTAHMVYCTEAGCKRPDKGFTRSDNFRKHMQKVHGRGAVTDGASPGLPTDPEREHVAPDKGNARRAESEDVQALGKKLRELQDKVDVLCRQREAEAQRQREREAENARLFGLLGRVASSGGSQEVAKGGQDGR